MQETRPAGPVYGGLTGHVSSMAIRGVRWRLLMSGIWMVFLVKPVSDLFHAHRGPLVIGGALALLVVFCAIYVAVMITWASPPAVARWGLPAMLVLATVACLVFGAKHWNGLWLFVSAAVGLGIPARRHAIRAVLACGAWLVLLSLIGHDNPADYLLYLLLVIVIGLATSGLRSQVMLMRELSLAREEVARLAASEERLRLARDLHDVTGQSLSMITLKSELAARHLARLPASEERDRAAEQIEEVAAVSRQTLRDIREAVSGYRRPTLAVEIITARMALEAAGIEVSEPPELTMLSGTFDPDAEAALAWCLREAVTNVTRHSGARTCTITLTRRDGQASLAVADDGLGITPATSDPATSGSGLRGMSERLGSVGGRLHMGPGQDGRGFRLVATAPAPDLPACRRSRCCSPRIRR
jgi:two-component system, NarL family, sensor histidine kinase DesK